MRGRTFFVLSLLLLIPALWNGAALVFPDTGGYLLRPFEGTLRSDAQHSTVLFSPLLPHSIFGPQSSCKPPPRRGLSC